MTEIKAPFEFLVSEAISVETRHEGDVRKKEERIERLFRHVYPESVFRASVNADMPPARDSAGYWLHGDDTFGLVVAVEIEVS